MTRALVSAFVVLALGACDPTPRTQVTVLVDADDAVRRDAATLEVAVYDEALEPVESATLTAAFPHELVAYRIDRDGFVMEIVALDASGEAVARDAVRVAFAPEQVKLLELRLAPLPASCPASCSPDQRCTDAACVEATPIDAATLPDRPAADAR